MQMRRNSNSFRTLRSESCSQSHRRKLACWGKRVECRFFFYESCMICNMDVIDSFLLQRPVKLCLFLKWILAGCRCDLHHLRLNLNETPWHFHDIFWLHSCGLRLEEGLQNVSRWELVIHVCRISASSRFWWMNRPRRAIFQRPLRFVSRRLIFSRPALAFWGYWAWVPYPDYAGMPRNSHDRPCLFQQNWSDEMMPSFRGASIVATHRWYG